jgi:hypothetical protein
MFVCFVIIQLCWKFLVSLLFYGSDHMLVCRVEEKVFFPLDDDLYMGIGKLTLFFFTSWQLNCILPCIWPGENEVRLNV